MKAAMSRPAWRKGSTAKSIQVIMNRAAELGMSQPTEGQILYVQFPEEGGGESMALGSGK